MNGLPPFFRFVSIATIWGTTALISLALIFANEGRDFNWIMLLVLFGIASGATGSIANGGQESAKGVSAANKNDASASKAKRDQAGLSPEILALLNEEDLYELRQRLKARLMERIDNGTDGELASLDELLADSMPTRRKR